MKQLILIVIALMIVACGSKKCVSCSAQSPLELMTERATEGIEGMDFHEVVDHTRTFINANSQHTGPIEFDLSDINQWAKGMNDYMDGKRDKPHLQCGHRARLHMAALSK